MSASGPGPRIIVALDFPRPEPARRLAETLDPRRCRVKVGKELFTRAGPGLVEELAGRGFDVFLDLKYHDIPNTVAGACSAAADLGVWMLNLHASGGRRMMEAARERLGSLGRRPLVIAVTILTSLEAADLAEVGLSGDPRENVLRLSRLARSCGMDGVVCSPAEAADVRAAVGPAFALVTPGVRPAGAELADQRRITTPAQAIGSGADYLVIGRPITAAADPLASLSVIEAEVQRAVN